MVAGRFLWVFKDSSWQGKICFCKRGPATLEHQEHWQTNAVFEKVKVSGTFLSFHLLSHTEASHMSPILAEFWDGRGGGCSGGCGTLRERGGDVKDNKNSEVLKC